MPKSKSKLKTSLANLKSAHVQHKKQEYKEKLIEKGKQKKSQKLMNRNELLGADGSSTNFKNKLNAMNDKERKKYESERLKHSKVPYITSDTILLIGEGNFSFASALCKILKDGKHVWATSYDSEEDLLKKYGDECKEHINVIESLGGKVFYEVDGTKLEKFKKKLQTKLQEESQIYENIQDAYLEKVKGKMEILFDKIIFNFPHAGLGIKDQARNILSNQELLIGVYKSCRNFVKPKVGELHITVKTGLPYDQWRISSLAKADDVWFTKDCFPFDPSLYPGYEHRRTLGFREGVSKDGNAEIIEKFPKTYIFGLSAPSKKR